MYGSWLSRSELRFYLDFFFGLTFGSAAQKKEEIAFISFHR